MAVGAFLRKVFLGKALPAELSYEEARAVLEAHQRSLEKELAERADTEPEMLYYLAERGDEKSRRAVAANPAAPAAANRLLAEDIDEEVRSELARKIGRLLPDLLDSERERITQLTLETLRKLADDQLPRVRAILADEIKSLTCVPDDVIKKLAHDAEQIVAVPILEYSPLLSDNDLLEVIASARAQAALAAIARRRGVSETVSEAVVASLDIPAVAALLNNPDSRIRERTLERVIDHAQNLEPLQGPLVLRTDLSVRALRRIAGFVSASLLNCLSVRHDLDEETQIVLTKRMRERLDRNDEAAENAEEKARNEVEALHKRGDLDDAYVEQVVEEGNKEYLIESLSCLSGAPRMAIEKILYSRSAKAVTSICWHCKLSMRTAFKIQTLVLKLSAGELLPARQGRAFPLSEDEMRWHLSYFGFVAAANP